jgi:hypothetical protein
MSTLAVNTITNATGGNTAQINGMTPTAQSLQGFRNRIINGNMVIDQRNAGASVTIAQGGAGFSVDRFQIGNFRTAGGSITAQQSSVVPAANFVNSLIVTNGSAGASAASDAVFVQQKIEGFNTADFGWGTASAQPITISFWVRSSVTGTYGVSVRGSDRSYIGSVVINQANTYEYKTINIPAITTGTWNTTNGEGVALLFDLGIGSTSSQTGGSWQNTANYGLTGGTKWYLTSGATFYITGVQFEVGSVATPFEQIDYGRELIMCQRYYSVATNTGVLFSPVANLGNFGGAVSSFVLPVTMRTTPTLSYTQTAASSWNGAIVTNDLSRYGFSVSSTVVQTTAGAFYAFNWTASAEL